MSEVKFMPMRKYAYKIENEHKFTKLLLDAMPLTCHLWDRNFNIFIANEANVKLFEVGDKRELENRFLDFSPEYQPDGELSSVKSRMNIKKAFDEGRCVFEWMHQKLDGTPIPTEIILERISYDGDYVVAAYIRDLREHKRMMEEIEQRDRLLESALEEAREASRAKSDFLASMSHEMRTPLNAVVGLSELTLGARGLDGEIYANLEKIYNAGLTLLSIVNDILDISKIEAGKFELLPVEYDMPSLINDTVTQNILRIREKPINFILDINETLPTQLYGDELRIKEVFNNLLSNAFKYTAEGTVKFTVSCEREKDTDNIWMTACIRDTGIGIRPEDLKRLFSDYNQVDTRANRKIQGTGLGLAITRKIVDLMGGSVTVESEYGKGSAFTVKIPQKFVTDAEIGPEVVANLKNFSYSRSKRDRNSKMSRIQLPYARVLVVDDMLTNLEVTKGMMKPYGMQVDCVTSGREAIKRIAAGEPVYDAVFMDHMMPEMDGVEAAFAIRSLDSEYARTIPVIALTANAISGTEQMFLKNGFQAFISKPIDVMQLDSVIRRWVQDKSRENTQYSHSINPKAKPRTIKIPGVDAEKGLARFGGDIEAYISVLRSYAENTPEILDKLRDVTEKNIKGYAVAVHGLKGASAGIGADTIAKKAAELEKTANSGDFHGVSDKNAAFLKDAEILVKAIRSYLDKPDNKTVKKRLPSPDREILARLRQSCEKYDMDGIDAAMDILESVSYDKNGSLILWLREKIDGSDFIQAAILLEEYGKYDKKEEILNDRHEAKKNYCG